MAGRDERLLELHEGGLRLGLRGSDGKVVAELCGFTRGTRFHMLRQLNDVNFERLSLSTVLRGYSVEHLIRLGHSELQFMGGSSLIFGRFCVPQMYRSIFVDKKKGVTAAAKRLGSKMVKLTALMGGRVPETLKVICNGHLEEWRLVERTALGPARIVFPERSVF